MTALLPDDEMNEIIEADERLQHTTARTEGGKMTSVQTHRRKLLGHIKALTEELDRLQERNHEPLDKGDSDA